MRDIRIEQTFFSLRGTDRFTILLARVLREFCVLTYAACSVNSPTQPERLLSCTWLVLKKMTKVHM